jgi:DNA-binding phage protein
MNFRILASEFLRALRGKRSQSAFSKRLGYRANVSKVWEAGRRFPAATDMFRAAALKRDLRDALGAFFFVKPRWLATIDPTSSSFVAALLSDLKGERSIVDLAAASGLSRFAVARFLSGAATPRVPDFFALIEASSRRLLDFVALFVDPTALPSARDEWLRAEALRKLAYDHPWSEAFLRVVETEAYLAPGDRRAGWIADRLGVDRDVEIATVAAMRAAGAIEKRGGRYHLDRGRSINTGSDRRAASRLKQFWSRVAAERIAAGAEGNFSYSVFAVTEEDYQRLKELQRSYYRELLATLRRSPRAERVVVANAHLFALDDPR